MIGEIGQLFLDSLLAYLISLASEERSAAIAATREQNFNKALKDEEALRRALASTNSIRHEIRATCAELARNRARLGVSAREEPLWKLLSDPDFQANLAEWMMAGAIEEGIAVKGRLL